MEQGSPEWLAIKAGKISGSRFKAVMALHKRTGKPNRPRLDLIADLRREWPELFAKKRTRRESVAGEGDRDGSRERRKPKSASEQAADKLLRRSA